MRLYQRCGCVSKEGNFIFEPDLNLQRNWALVEKHDMAKIFLFCEIMRKDNVCPIIYVCFQIKKYKHWAGIVIVLECKHKQTNSGHIVFYS